MLGPAVLSMKQKEVYQLLPALTGLAGIFILDLLTPLGVAVWIGYVFPVWYVSRRSFTPSVSLPLVALASTGLMVQSK